MKTFRKGGIHPKDSKTTSEIPISVLPLPQVAVVPLSQCIGAPARCVVKVKDIVTRGQLIAEASGFVSANVHSSVNGTVKKIEQIRTPQGLWQEAIIIETAASDDCSPVMPDDSAFTGRTESEIAALSSAEITGIVRDAGIVGLGGATFPTAVKLTVPEGKHVDTVIINGAECEPYLTCDDRLMRERPSEILLGVRLLMRATGAKKAIIGIEDNKMEAIRALKGNSNLANDMEVVALKKKYPQGSEKQLIAALTGKRVPTGGLPVDVGSLVDNVATAFAVYDAVYNGKPLIDRVVTLTGEGLSKPGNFIVANGTSIDSLLQAAGADSETVAKVIAGGPMMGRAVSHTDAPATKGLSGLVTMSEKEAMRKPSGPCIRCARCIEACPMGLEPYLLMSLALSSEWEIAKEHDILSCLECGCCSYTCPANRPLLDYIKLARQELKKSKK